MERPASAIVAAELRVVQSRRELRERSRRLRYRLSRPSFLAAAAALVALLGISLTRGLRMRALAGALAVALLRRGVSRLLARADSSRRIRSP